MPGLRVGALLLAAAGTVRGEDGGATGCADVTSELDGANMQPAEGDDVLDEASSWTGRLVGDACDGTAVGETCGNFACKRGYESGQLMCGEGGVWVVEACSDSSHVLQRADPDTCHISDDLTCVGLAVAVCALVAAVIAMLLLPRILNRNANYLEGRSLYSDERDSLDLGGSIDVQDVDEYGDQDAHAAKKRSRGSTRRERGDFEAVAASDEVIVEP